MTGPAAAARVRSGSGSGRAARHRRGSLVEPTAGTPLEPVDTVQRWYAILVTGMSGTGTSTALAALARRGFAVVDTTDEGLSVRDLVRRRVRQDQVMARGRRSDGAARTARQRSRAPGTPAAVRSAHAALAPGDDAV